MEDDDGERVVAVCVLEQGWYANSVLSAQLLVNQILLFKNLVIFF